jgi:acetoin utilization deacetylase AcuC-like enzyme
MPCVYTERHRLHATDDVRLEGERFESKEVPARAEVLRAAVEAAALGPMVEPFDLGLSPLLAVHAADYVAYLQTASARYAEAVGEVRPLLSRRSEVSVDRAAIRPESFPELADYYTYDYEDPILPGTWEAAYWSAQVALTAAELVRQGEFRAAYALCRPPGHHAMRDQYGGFCYLNNAAIAARYLSRSTECGGAPRGVAILDLDYHHGNGTQAIFYTDPTVLYVSLHADPVLDYPHFWGRADERGSGPGLGTNLNLPLPLHCDDARYLAALDEALARIAGFAPAYLVISLGLDALGGDTIGKFDLTPMGWTEAARRVAQLGTATVIVQEGGYCLERIGHALVRFLSAFAESQEMCHLSGTISGCAASIG